MASLLFWASVALVGYVYVGYPLLLLVWARARNAVADRIRKSDINPKSESRNPKPGVSIVIAARNEARRLPARIENLLSLDFPAALRQIIVVSDGSTDDTLAALQPHADVVDVVDVPAGGKARALNAGVAAARHEILVFADARQAFADDALRELVNPFDDPAVGGVTGELLLDAETPCRRVADRRSDAGPSHAPYDRRAGADRRRTMRSTIAEGIGLYWRYEKQLRRGESAVGSTLGATGAIYAIRRTLWQPLPADTILDDVLTPMRVVLAGYRMVFNERARAYDRAAGNAEIEARRKVRTLAGNYQILGLEPRLLLPLRNPVWLQYVSHKIGRLAVPYALVVAFCASIVLSTTSRVYAAALAAQVLFYLLAGYGALLELAARRGAAAAHTVVEPRAAPRRVA